jgi:hypothetical protein
LIPSILTLGRAIVPSNPRPALKTIIKTARLAREYLEIVEAGHDLSDFPFV